MFLIRPELEVFYGGAAGGGKSDALLMAALQYADTPGYAALLLRKTFADLSKPEALMDRAREWLTGTGAKWRDREHTWEFPSGARLCFGYVDTEKDKFQYQSAAYQFIGFDELTHFTETQYTYLFSRIRRTTGLLTPDGKPVPARMRAASNPGGDGHEWVKQRFIVDPAAAGRYFVPARFVDNPHIDQDEYAETLQQLDHITRAQLKDGDWDVTPEGKLFRREWFRILDAAPPLEEEVRCWDFAATEKKQGNDPDYVVGVRMGRTKDKQYVVTDVRRGQLTPLGVERLVRQTAEEDGRRVKIRAEQEPGSSGKQTADRYCRELLAGYAALFEPSTGSKLERAQPFSAAAENGNVMLLRGQWLTEYLDELCAFPSPGVHDDQVDASSGAFGVLTGGHSSLTVPLPSAEQIAQLNSLGPHF